jgi:hypothetical protein
MPTNVTPAAGWPTIQAPLNGEAGDAGALLTTTIQPIADRIEQLRSRVVGGGTGYQLTVPCGAHDRVNGSVLATVPVISGSVGATGDPYLAVIDSAATYAVEWWYRLPAGSVISAAKVVLEGIAGSGRPTNMPRMRLIRVDVLGVQTVLMDEVDTSPSDAAFRTIHAIYQTGLSIFVGSGDAIVLVLAAAGSTAGQDNVAVYGGGYLEVL